MAGRGDIQAGSAFVRLFMKDSELIKGLQRARAKLKAFADASQQAGSLLTGIGSRIALAFGGTAALAIPIKMAGDMAETISKFGAVFGDNAKEVRKWSDDFSSSIGRARAETYDAMAAFQSFFVGMGVGQNESTDLSKKMQKLAVDFASFHNLTDKEGLERFISGLSGSSEVFDRFGVNLKVSALDIKLLAMGFPKVTQGATEMQKALARVAIIEETMGRQGAIGDAIKTAGGFSNQMKALRASVMESAVAIGEALLPVVTPMVTMFSKVAQSVAEFIKENAEVVVTIAKVASGVAAAGAAIAGMGLALTAVGSTITAIGTIGTLIGAIAGAAVPLLAVGAVVASIGAGIYAWVKYTDSGKAAFASLSKIVSDIGATFKTAFGGIVDALKAGDLQLAWKIAVAGLGLVWQQATVGIRNAWTDTVNYMTNLWSDAVNQISTKLLQVNNLFRIGRIIVTEGVSPNEARKRARPEYDAEKRALDEDTQRAKNGRNAAAEAAKAERQANIDAAQAELSRLRGEAEGALRAQEIAMYAKKNEIAAAAAGASSPNIASKVFGTFSASSAAASSGSRSNAQERTAKAAEKALEFDRKVERLLNELVRVTKESPLVIA